MTGNFLGGWAERPAARELLCNPTTRNCIFSLDTTRVPAQNPRNFFRGFPVQGTEAVHCSRRTLRRAENVHRKRKKSRVIPEGEKACSICRDGQCNASIRSARLAATGCGRLIPEENSAAIATLRSTMSRRRSAHACGCVPARWAVTVHRAARRDDSANRRERSSGPLVRLGGRAVPASPSL